MVMAGGLAQAKYDGERASAARPRAPWKRGGEGETERTSEDWRRERERDFLKKNNLKVSK